MFNINQNFALKSAELFNFERDAYRTTADLFGQPLTYFPDRFVVTVTSDGSRYQLDKSKAPSNKLTPTDTLSDAERMACWLPLPTVADKSKMANMVTSTGLTGGTITIAAGDGKAVKSLANGSVGKILKIGTDGLEWANESTFTLSPPKDGNIGGVKPGSGLTVDTDGTLSIKLGSGLTIDNGSVELSKNLKGMTLTNTILTGITTTPTPNGNQGNEVTNVTYVDTKIESAVGGLSKALVFIGEVSGGITPSNAKVGYVYVVTDNGTYAEQKCEPGDTLICKKNGIQTSDGWIVVEKNIDGAVTASSELTNGAIVVGSGGTKVHTIATPTENGMVLQSTANGIEWKKPSTYSLTVATKSDIGGVIIGNGINVTSNGTISLSGGTGISISTNEIINTGVISVTSGTSANQISVKKGNNTTEIITINNVENASLAHKLPINGGSVNDDDVLVVGNYQGGPTYMGGGIGPGEFTPTHTVGKDGDYYQLNVSKADTASKLSVDGGKTSTNGVLLIGNYSAGTTINGNAIPGNFTATDFITSTESDDFTFYEMFVSLAVDAITADKVYHPLIIKPLNDKGNLETIEENLIKYDGSKDIALDAITTGEIDDLFNTTPTV